MKLKSLIYAGFCSMALFATSCSDEQPDYEPAPACPSLEVYFDPTETTSLNVGETDTEFTVTVYRADKEQAATYPVSVGEATDMTKFTVPSSVSFAAGESVTEFPVSYVATALEPMKAYDLTLVVGKGENTPYAWQRINYTITYFPWEDVVGPNGEVYGTYVEDCLTSWFTFSPNPNPSWDIKIQKSPAIKGLYRIVNCYEKFPIAGYYDGGTENNYLYFNAADPTQVFLCNQEGKPTNGSNPVLFRTGLDMGYGAVYITGDYNFEAADGNIDPSLAGSMTNGVVKFPEKALLAAMANYQNGNFYYANKNGKFRILFPGAVEEEETDPDDVWEPIGTAEYTDVLICPLYGGGPETWSVEVEQWKKDPNMYRMVNPYKDGVMPDGWNYDGDKYIELDATNPQCVLWEMQPIWEDSEYPVNGDIYALNLAANFVAGGKTLEQIIASGYGDTFENMTFTFGPAHLRMYFPDTTNDNYKDKLLTADTENEGKIVLSTTATSAARANYTAGVMNRVANFNPYKISSTNKMEGKIKDCKPFKTLTVK